jgi:hypothetical protein
MSHNNTEKKCEIDSKTKGKIMFQGMFHGKNVSILSVEGVLKNSTVEI